MFYIWETFAVIFCHFLTFLLSQLQPTHFWPQTEITTHACHIFYCVGYPITIVIWFIKVPPVNQTGARHIQSHGNYLCLFSDVLWNSARWQSVDFHHFIVNDLKMTSFISLSSQPRPTASLSLSPWCHHFIKREKRLFLLSSGRRIRLWFPSLGEHFCELH